MARIRSLKPEFFTDDELGALCPVARLLFAGLWCQADREGRLDDRPARIKITCLPYDDVDINELLQQLHDAGFIQRYQVESSRYIQVVNFTKHQMPHYKEVASAIPPPPGHEDSRYATFGVSQAQRNRILARDGEVCQDCGATEDLSIDHVVPRSQGGSGEDENLQVLCRRCNSRKNNRLASANVGSTSGQRQANVDPSLHADPDPDPDPDQGGGVARARDDGPKLSLDGTNGTVPTWKTPALADVKRYAETVGRGELAEPYYDYRTSVGWAKTGGLHIIDWTADFRMWIRGEDARIAQGRSNAPPAKYIPTAQRIRPALEGGAS